MSLLELNHVDVKNLFAIFILTFLIVSSSGCVSTNNGDIVIDADSVKRGFTKLFSEFFKIDGGDNNIIAIDTLVKSPEKFLDKKITVKGELVEKKGSTNVEEEYFLINEQGFYIPIKTPYKDVRIFEENEVYRVQGKLEEKENRGKAYVYINASKLKKTS